MITEKGPITRVEISIPFNRNTASIINDIKIHLSSVFGGVTYSKIVRPSLFSGDWYDKEADKLWIEDTVLFIIYFKYEEYIEAFEDLKIIAELLIHVGEVETWQIYHNAHRLRCVSSK